MSFLLKQTVDENYAFKRSQRIAKKQGAKTGHRFKKSIQFIGLRQIKHPCFEEDQGHKTD
jgi:hypothetical protein